MVPVVLILGESKDPSRGYPGVKGRVRCEGGSRNMKLI